MAESESQSDEIVQGTDLLPLSGQQRQEGADLGTIHSHAQFRNNAPQERVIANGKEWLPTNIPYELNGQT